MAERYGGIDPPHEVIFDIRETLSFCDFIVKTLDKYIQGSSFESYVFKRKTTNYPKRHIRPNDYKTVYKESKYIFQLAVANERKVLNQKNHDPFRYKRLNDLWFALWQSGLTDIIGKIKRDAIKKTADLLRPLRKWSKEFLKILEKLLKLINTFLQSLIGAIPGADALDEIKQAAEILLDDSKDEN